MRPVVFSGCFGWFHPAPGARGIVLCSPHGHEALYAHRAWRGLAQKLAQAGLPTLRFDYAGTGDSVGDDEQPGRLRAWLDSIKAAVAWMRAEAGVTQVDLVGLRLGATLALAAAREIEDLEGIALLAPPLSGKAYVRELKALAMVAAALEGIPSPPATWDGNLEAAGFLLTAETIGDLAQLDLLQMSRPPAARALVLHRPGTASDVRLLMKMAALGCQVSEDVFAGYDEFMRDAHFSTAPEPAFSLLTDWLKAGAPAASAAVATDGAIGPPTADGQLTIGEIVEKPVVFGDRAALFGIRCAGPQLACDRPAVLFLNTGSNHHVGSNRLWVTLARRLARQGFLSLRFDLAGIGDSPAAPGKPDNRLYSKHSCADVRAALDWLESEGHHRAVVVGLCSGAYVAFHTAIEDARIVGQVLINAQRFVWNQGDSLEIAMRRSFKSTRYYLERARKPETWGRAISGGVNLAGIGRTLFERGIKRAGSSVFDVRGRVLGSEAETSEVVRGFYLLSDRGVETLLLYGAQDGGLDELEAHLGRDARKLKGRTNVRIVLLEGADHTLTAPWAQDRFAAQLEGFLGLRFKPDYAHAPAREDAS